MESASQKSKLKQGHQITWKRLCKRGLFIAKSLDYVQYWNFYMMNFWIWPISGPLLCGVQLSFSFLGAVLWSSCISVIVQYTYVYVSIKRYSSLRKKVSFACDNTTINYLTRHCSQRWGSEISRITFFIEFSTVKKKVASSMSSSLAFLFFISNVIRRQNYVHVDAVLPVHSKYNTRTIICL